MECVAILDSSNYVFKLCSILERKGYVFEIAATPCQIAKGGCGYCIRFPGEYRDLLISEGITSGLPVREIYSIIPMFSKNRYERIY